jgi:hypothetical protein
MLRVVVAAFVSLCLAGCAGYHSIPPQTYSMAGDGVERIVFDQRGDPYPRSGGVDGPPVPPVMKRGRAFSIRTYYERAGIAYDREALIAGAADRIVKSLDQQRARRVVMLIKGFNNSYQSNEEDYANVRQWLSANGPLESVVMVQVYWDAIHRDTGTAPAPLAYFGESMTYSNLAGACGLRDLLTRLPAGTDVTFVTHSRGAAVALSAAADPLFDPKIDTACLSAPGDAPRPLQLGDVRLVAFAPALGDGHLRARDGTPRTDLFEVIDHIYSSVDRNDPAVTKSLWKFTLPDKLGGDTRFGGTPIYVEGIDGLFAERGHVDDFAQVTFTQPTHHWMRYLGETDNARCLLWAGAVLRDRPSGCALRR